MVERRAVREHERDGLVAGEAERRRLDGVVLEVLGGLREVQLRLIDQHGSQREVDRERADRDDEHDQRGVHRRDARPKGVMGRSAGERGPLIP